MSAWARDSLRLRLLAGTLAWVLLSVLLAGWGLRALLREHITQQLQQQLVVQLDALSGSIDSLPGGREREEHQPDARLQQPLSGLYWQIDRLGANPQPGLARSRSLWDQVLSVPPTALEPAARGDQVLSLSGAVTVTLTVAEVVLALRSSVATAWPGACRPRSIPRPTRRR